MFFCTSMYGLMVIFFNFKGSRKPKQFRNHWFMVLVYGESELTGDSRHFNAQFAIAKAMKINL